MDHNAKRLLTFCDIASLDFLLPLGVGAHGSRNGIKVFPSALSSQVHCPYAISSGPGNTDRALSSQSTLQFLRGALRTVRNSKDRCSHLRVSEENCFHLSSLLVPSAPLSPIRCPVPSSCLHSSSAPLNLVCFPREGPVFSLSPTTLLRNFISKNHAVIGL